MSSLVAYEPYVDDYNSILGQRLDEMARAGVALDMGHWFQCYAFDVIGTITFSRRLGFLDAGLDVGGILAALQGNMVYCTLVGIHSGLHPYIFPRYEQTASRRRCGKGLLVFLHRRDDRETQGRANVRGQGATRRCREPDYCRRNGWSARLLGQVARLACRGPSVFHNQKRRCRHELQHHRRLRHHQHDPLRHHLLPGQEPVDARDATRRDRRLRERRPDLESRDLHRKPNDALSPSRDTRGAVPASSDRPAARACRARTRADDLRDFLSARCKKMLPPTPFTSRRLAPGSK